VITNVRVYNPEGGLESASGGGQGQVDSVMMRNGSLMSSLIVALHRTPSGFVVEVIPKTFQFIDTPKPRELAPDDPALPGFIHGRVDALAFRIYELGKPYLH
jgi:hypothetical protein